MEDVHASSNQLRLAVVPTQPSRVWTSNLRNSQYFTCPFLIFIIVPIIISFVSITIVFDMYRLKHGTDSTSESTVIFVCLKYA